MEDREMFKGPVITGNLVADMHRARENERLGAQAREATGGSLTGRLRGADGVSALGRDALVAPGAIEQTHRAVADLHVSAEAARQRLDRVCSRLMGGPEAYGSKPDNVEAQDNGEIGRLLSEVRRVQAELDRAHDLIERLEGL